MRFAALLALLWLTACNTAQPIAVVSCDDLSIGFDVPGYNQTCKSGPLNMSRPQDGSVESVYATNGARRLVFVAARVGVRSAFHKETPQSLAADEDMFHGTRNWRPHPAINGFDVALFEGRPLPQTGFLLECAGFVDNSRPVSKSIGGVSKILFGFYCEDNGNEIAPAYLEVVMDGLRF